MRSIGCGLSAMKHFCYTMNIPPSNDKKPLHMHCPDGKDSWCGYKRDKANTTSTYKHGKGLPLEVSLQMRDSPTRNC